MLEPILKGLIEWLYEMMLDIMAYASGELLGVMSMDLSYGQRSRTSAARAMIRRHMKTAVSR